jgi:hypothetical protein
MVGRLAAPLTIPFWCDGHADLSDTAGRPPGGGRLLRELVDRHPQLLFNEVVTLRLVERSSPRRAKPERSTPAPSDRRPHGAIDARRYPPAAVTTERSSPATRSSIRPTRSPCRTWSRRSYRTWLCCSSRWCRPSPSPTPACWRRRSPSSRSTSSRSRSRPSIRSARSPRTPGRTWPTGLRRRADGSARSSGRGARVSLEQSYGESRSLACPTC